jgi:hypothetical protein
MKQLVKAAEARKLFFSGLLAFLALEVALNLYMETRHSEVYDPEYRDRLTLLRQRLKENPDRPLLLFIGSSRFMTGIAPEQLPTLESSDGQSPLPFNACHCGGGALQNLLTLRRLVNQGIEPRWLVAEVVPNMLPATQRSMVAKGAIFNDLQTLHHYMNPLKLVAWYAEERATAIVNHRQSFLRCLAPGLPLEDSAWDTEPMEPLGGKSWTEPVLDAQEIKRRKAIAREAGFASFENFSIDDTSRHAFADLLDLCRRKNIHVVLLLSPECAEFRGCYPPRTLQILADFLESLHAQFGVPIIDASDWLADEDFSDGHHVLPEGAKKLTARLARDVLGPLVRDELDR